MAKIIGKKTTKFITTLLTWLGAAVLYFVIFSALLTPLPSTNCATPLTVCDKSMRY